MSTVVNNIVPFKDSRWLTLEVCREFQRNKCTRSDTECKYAHPLPHVEVQNGRVTACFDSIKGRCNREKPPCKYLHPPQHLKEQLLVNGRNNLALKNAALMGQYAAAANVSFNAAPLLQIPLVGGTQSCVSQNAAALAAALGPLVHNGVAPLGASHGNNHSLNSLCNGTSTLAHVMSGGSGASGNGTPIVLTPHPHTLTPFSSHCGNNGGTHYQTHPHSHPPPPPGAGPMPLTGTEILIAPDGTPLVLGYIIPPPHHLQPHPGNAGTSHHHHHFSPSSALLPPPPPSMLPPSATVIPVLPGSNMHGPPHMHPIPNGGHFMASAEGLGGGGGTFAAIHQQQQQYHIIYPQQRSPNNIATTLNSIPNIISSIPKSINKPHHTHHNYHNHHTHQLNQNNNNHHLVTANNKSLSPSSSEDNQNSAAFLDASQMCHQRLTFTTDTNAVVVMMEDSRSHRNVVTPTLKNPCFDGQDNVVDDLVDGVGDLVDDIITENEMMTDKQMQNSCLLSEREKHHNASSINSDDCCYGTREKPNTKVPSFSMKKDTMPITNADEDIPNILPLSSNESPFTSTNQLSSTNQNEPKKSYSGSLNSSGYSLKNSSCNTLNNLSTPASLCSSSSIKSFPSSRSSSPIPSEQTPAPLSMKCVGEKMPPTYATVLQTDSRHKHLSNINNNCDNNVNSNHGMMPRKSGVNNGIVGTEQIQLPTQPPQSISRQSQNVFPSNCINSSPYATPADAAVAVINGVSEDPGATSNLKLGVKPKHKSNCSSEKTATTNLKLGLENYKLQESLVSGPKGEAVSFDNSQKLSNPSLPATYLTSNGYHDPCECSSGTSSTSAIYINASLNCSTDLAHGISGNTCVFSCPKLLAPSPKLGSGSLAPKIKPVKTLTSRINTLPPVISSSCGSGCSRNINNTKVAIVTNNEGNVQQLPRKRGRLEASIFYEHGEMVKHNTTVSGNHLHFSPTPNAQFLSGPINSNKVNQTGNSHPLTPLNYPNYAFIDNSPNSNPNIVYYCMLPVGGEKNNYGLVLNNNSNNKNQSTNFGGPSNSMYLANSIGDNASSSVINIATCQQGSFYKAAPAPSHPNTPFQQSVNQISYFNHPHQQNIHPYSPGQSQQFFYLTGNMAPHQPVSIHGAVNQNNSCLGNAVLANNAASGVALNACASSPTAPGFLALNGGGLNENFIHGTCLDPSSIGFLNTGVKRVAYQQLSTPPNVQTSQYDGLTDNQIYYQNNHHTMPLTHQMLGAHPQPLTQGLPHQLTNFGVEVSAHSFHQIIAAGQGTPFHHPSHQSVLATVSTPIGNHPTAQYYPVAFATPGAVNGIPPY